MNELYNILGGNNLVSRFMQFRKSFSGDPRQQVQQLIDSGKITQSQYNDAVQKANQLYKLLNT